MKNIIILLVIVAVVGIAIYFYLKNKKQTTGTTGAAFFDDLGNKLAVSTTGSPIPNRGGAHKLTDAELAALASSGRG
jgi:uncharacterized protein involved in cysteine biosynthesis